MRGVHGGMVLEQELRAFLLGQVPENDRRVIGSSTSADWADMPSS